MDGAAAISLALFISIGKLPPERDSAQGPNGTLTHPDGPDETAGTTPEWQSHAAMDSPVQRILKFELSPFQDAPMER
jgi:hypothetical protein